MDVLAKEIGLLADEIEIYGKSKAKVQLSLLERLKVRRASEVIAIKVTQAFFTTGNMLCIDCPGLCYCPLHCLGLQCHL